MRYVRGRYSWLLRPILMVFDIITINIFAHYVLIFQHENIFLFFNFYSIIVWLSSAFWLGFYEVYRYTSILNIFSLLIKQFVAFTILVFAFLGMVRDLNLPTHLIVSYLLYSFVAIGFIKVLSFYFLKMFRTILKGNLRNVVVIGEGDSVTELINIFKNNKDLGYNVKAVFGKSLANQMSGSIADSFKFLESDETIDEIYCAIDELSEKDINKYVKISEVKHCNIKFIPNRSKLFTKRLSTDYYSYIPVLSLQEVSINNKFNKVIKRTFDILFSLFVIIFVLSWVSLILFILIKLESKGPLYYRHKRNGINYKEFYCYKFRSLTITEEVKGAYVKKNDNRVTRIGRFMRKTSIDELPQFINVLIGDMSVVGPRPHMLSYTDDYSKKVDKYSFIYRHHVKPGISGLAQIKGYRGEVETDIDIINRVKYDIFYIENWSLLLDIKIIIQTFLNVIKGDEKAY